MFGWSKHTPKITPGKWEFLGGEFLLDFGIVRTCSWTGFPAPDHTAKLRIECGVGVAQDTDDIRTKLGFRFSPFKIHQDQTLVLALFTEEPKGGFIEVKPFP